MNQPRFRTDLVTSPAIENGTRFVDVTDPDSGRTFRFYEVEYAVASAMDGKRDVGGIVEWAREELGLSPSRGEVETVISTLGALGYLLTDGDETADTTAFERPDEASLDISDLSLGAPGKSPIRADASRRREASNVDLGSPGRSPMAQATANTAKRPANELELGAAGGSDTDGPSERPTAPPPVATQSASPGPAPEPPPLGFGEGVQDVRKTLMGTGPAFGGGGAPAARVPEVNAPGANVPSGADLSVDLGQHINLGTDDVKEAVRASQVMAVPEVNYPSAPIEAPGSTPIELPSRPPGPSAAVPGRIGRPSHQGPLVSQPATPNALPNARAGKGPSGMTIGLFVGLLAAVIGAAYYFFIYAPSDSEGEAEAPTKLTANPETPATKTGGAANAPVGMLKQGEKSTVKVTAPVSGKLEWLIAADATVKEGDVVAKLSGFQEIEAKRDEAMASRKRYETKLERAKKAGKKVTIAELAANVKRKEGDINRAQKQLDGLVVKAPTSGVAAVSAKNGDEITTDTEIVAISTETWPTAEFALPDTTSYKAGGKIEVVIKSDPSKSAVCEVGDVEAALIRVKCPPDSGLGENAALTIK